VTEDKTSESFLSGQPLAGKEEIMRNITRNAGPEMKEEYDFSSGVRGKYAKAYTKGTNIVILDPVVAKEFPDSMSVNEALRSLLPILKRHTHAAAK
jgi:hypothetical protein